VLAICFLVIGTLEDRVIFPQKPEKAILEQEPLWKKERELKEEFRS
jgi:hypothetical protein